MRAKQASLAAVCFLGLALSGCGKKEAAPGAEPAAPPPDVATEAANPAPDVAADDPAADYADGMSGGPDFWTVTGADETYGVNLRVDAGDNADINGALANGDVVRNLGCKTAGGERWCQVETPGDMPGTGWVPGRFLAESAAPE